MTKTKLLELQPTQSGPAIGTDAWFLNQINIILTNRELWNDIQVRICNEQFTLAQCLINSDALVFGGTPTSPATFNGYESAQELMSILAAKNHDYSNPDDCFSNFRMCEDFGLTVGEGIKVRMCDKVSRIKRLSGTENLVPGELLNDAWLDLAGYMVILYLFNETYFTNTGATQGIQH